MNLRKIISKGIQWTSYETIIKTSVQFLQSLILARLLSPEDFGLMAITLLVLEFIQPISELGLGSAIIQSKKLNAKVISTVFWLGVFLGIFCFMLVFVLSFLSSYFFENIEINRITILAGLTFLITPLGSQHGALISKALKFELQAKISIVASIATFTLAIVLACLGFGVYTLLGAYLTRCLVTSGLNLFFARHMFSPMLYFNLADIKDLLRFGFFQTGTRIVNYFGANIDKILIGRLLGTHALGLYTIAWNLVLIPLRKINPILTRITFPLFSKIAERKSLVKKYFEESMVLLILINSPILLFMGLLGGDLLELLYGREWLGAADTLSILCGVGLLKSFASPGGALILAQGRAEIIFYWNVIWSISLFVFIYSFLSIEMSIASVALAQLAAGAFIGPLWHFMVAYFGSIKYAYILKRFVLILIISIPTVLSCLLLNEFIGFDLIGRIVLKSTLFLIGFLSLFYFSFRSYFYLLMSTIKNG